MRGQATALLLVSIGCAHAACDASSPDAASTGASSSSSSGLSSSSSGGGGGGGGGEGGGGEGGGAGGGGAGSAGACVADMAIGSGFVVALRDDGTLFSWGRGPSALPKLPYAAPEPLDAPTDFIAVEAGSAHAHALRADGTVWTWGAGYFGTLGLGSNDEVAKPTAIPGLSDVVLISTSTLRSAVVTKDGYVYEWGYRYGANGPETSLVPVKVEGIPNEPIAAIGTANGFSVILTHYGNLYQWGPTIWTTPSLLLDNVKRISVSPMHWLALQNDGKLWEWGETSWDELALGQDPMVMTPIPHFEGVKDVFAGPYRNAVQASDDTVWVWGADPLTVYGALDPAPYPGVFKLPQPMGGALLPKSISLTETLAGYVNGKGQARLWGVGTQGELGGGNEGAYHAPVTIPGLTGTKLLRAGMRVGFAIGEDGSVFGWGNHSHGELGNGVLDRDTSPVAIAELSDIVDLAVGYQFGLALDGAGRVWSFGENDKGQLGDGTKIDHAKAKQVLGIPAMKAIAAGNHHALAVAVDGSVWAWGLNDSGQLGDGTKSASGFPKKVPGLSGAKQVGAGSCYSAVLLDNGAVWTFGCGMSGTLGTGFAEESLVPAQVTGISDVIALDAAEQYTLVLRADGTLWGWGWNQEAQLGDGQGVDNYGTPVQIPGLSSIVQVAAGFEHVLALDQNGDVWGWGTASRGELAGLAANYQKSPKKLDAISGAKAIAAGTNFSYYLGKDGVVRASGINYEGQMGIGVLPMSATPVDPLLPCLE